MTGPRRLYDEAAHAGAEHLDSGYVAAYDRKAAFDPAEDVSLLRSHGLDAASILVDLGCGTGTFALAAAALCRRVVAVDVSPAMLDAVRSRADRSGSDNLEPVQAGFLTYEHGGEPPDVVYSRNALHHLPDLWKAVALRRIAAMLRPGGILLLHDLVFSCRLDELRRVVSEWLEGAPADAAQGWTRSELEEHLSEEYSTFSWLLEPMLQQAGFEIIEAWYRPARTHAAYLASRPRDR